MTNLKTVVAGIAVTASTGMTLLGSAPAFAATPKAAAKVPNISWTIQNDTTNGHVQYMQLNGKQYKKFNKAMKQIADLAAKQDKKATVDDFTQAQLVSYQKGDITVKFTSTVKKTNGYQQTTERYFNQYQGITTASGPEVVNTATVVVPKPVVKPAVKPQTITVSRAAQKLNAKYANKSLKTVEKALIKKGYSVSYTLIHSNTVKKNNVINVVSVNHKTVALSVSLGK